MENLYKKLENKRNRFDSFNGDLGEGDYNLYLIEQFLPRLINDRIDSLKLKDEPIIDTLEDIAVNYNIHFLTSEDNIEPVMYIDDTYQEANNQRYKNCFIHISKDTYEYVVTKFCNLCEKDGILNGCIFDNKTSFLPTELTIRTNLKKMIYTYFNSYFIANQKDITINGDNILHFLRQSRYVLSSLESRYVDSIHTKVFEEEFLDKVVVNIIKKKINFLDQRNYQEKNIPIEEEVYLNPNFLTTYNILVSKEELDALIPLFKSFMTDYNLGHAGYLSNSTGMVKFETSLKDLMDAYYMEKQRIEHFNSKAYLLTKTQSNAKRIK